MKNLSLLLVSILTAFSAYSQSSFCGTDMPEEMLTWLKNRNQSGASAQKQADEAVYYIPLKIHIVGNDQGGGYYKISNLLDAMCKLNEDYLPVGFHFYIYGDIHYINNTDLYEHSGFNVGSIVRPNNVDDVANLYFVQDPAGNCGYFSGWSDYIALAKSCSGPNNSTVAHELGHYFSLPHTFSGWEGRSQSDPPAWDDEQVDGSNCNSAGDYFCDTPADFISDRWSCPYNDTKVDYNGDPYNVDGSLYMSYANDACQNKFSPDQILAMRDYLFDERDYLVDHPAPVVDSVAPAEAVYPVDGNTNVPANYVQLKWKKAQGATHYNLQVTRYFNGNFSNVDTIVQDTAIIITHLEAGYNYRWRIRPFNQGNTCTGYTTYSNFTTRTATSIVPNVNISGISCPGETDGSIQVGASGGTGPYTYEWSTGLNVQSLTDLTEGSYLVTITDSGNDSLVISFDIIEPETLDAAIAHNNSVLNAAPIGGTPPYNYAWSNGVTIPQTAITNAGEYALTITDSRGCSVTKSFYYTSIDDLNVTDTRIYPNPLQSGELLTIELTSKEAFKGAVELFDNTGRRIFTFDKTFTSGSNIETFSLPDLSQGIYMLRIKGDNGYINRKLVVM